MALSPSTYAQLLGDRISKHKVDVWLVNTGWSGGPYGVGQRIKLPVTRAIVKAVLDGVLKNAEMMQDPIFGVRVPTSCPEVPSEVLEPRKTWKDTAAYDRKARELAAMFEKNFKEEASEAPAEVREAGPKV